MLHRDIFILHGLGGVLCSPDGSVHILGDVDLTAGPPTAGDLGQLVDFCLDSGLKTGDGDSGGGEQLRDKAFAVADQSQKQMGLLNLLVPIFQGNVLGGLNGGEVPF